MLHHTRKRALFLILASLFMAAAGILSGRADAAGTISLPKTGQTKCFPTSGSNNSYQDCSASADQDGKISAGIPWPNPRFTINLQNNGDKNGTVTDNLTGLVWLQDASCSGTKTWAAALTFANTLADGNLTCFLKDGSTAGQWRLPNRVELQSIRSFQTDVLLDLNNMPIYIAHDIGGSLAFSHLQYLYWSSSTYMPKTEEAWYFHTGKALFSNAVKSTSYYVWPVRNGP